MPQFRDDELDGLGLFGSESAPSDSPPAFAPAESGVDAFAPERPDAGPSHARSSERRAPEIVALDARDALAAFASETPVPYTAPAPRRTADVLACDARADDGEQEETIPADAIPRVLPGAPHGRLVRWTLPLAATLFLVGPSALVGWHVARSRAIPGGAAPVPHPPAPFASAQALSSAPPVPADLPMLNVAAIDAPSTPIATTPASPHDSPVRADAPARPAVPGDTAPAPDDVDALPAREDSPRLAALAPAADAAAAPALELIAGVPVAAEPLSRAPAADDEGGVREALRTFRAAYERLDVDGATEIWPSVDRRALARAFDGLQSQSIEFERCDIAVTGEEATADCRGRIAVIRKVGNPVPLTADQRWLFTMRRQGPDWRIAAVVSSQSAAGGAEGADEPR